jgi:hypothetical protein
MEIKLISEVAKYDKKFELVQKNSFPDMLPGVLLKKYREIMSREIDDVGCNQK